MSTSSDVLESTSRWVEELTGQRVVVTGAAGQLGRFLVPAARRAGAAVIAFGSRAGAGIDVAADLAETDVAMPALEAARPDLVIHAAACTDVNTGRRSRYPLRFRFVCGTTGVNWYHWGRSGGQVFC